METDPPARIPKLCVVVDPHYVETLPVDILWDVLVERFGLPDILLMDAEMTAPGEGLAQLAVRAGSTLVMVQRQGDATYQHATMHWAMMMLDPSAVVVLFAGSPSAADAARRAVSGADGGWRPVLIVEEGGTESLLGSQEDWLSFLQSRT